MGVKGLMLWMAKELLKSHKLLLIISQQKHFVHDTRKNSRAIVQLIVMPLKYNHSEVVMCHPSDK